MKAHKVTRRFYGQAEIVVLVRKNVVVVDGGIAGDTLDDIDGLLVAPTDRPTSTATRCYENCFAQRRALFVLHGHSLAPVSSGVDVLA